MCGKETCVTKAGCYRSLRVSESALSLLSELDVRLTSPLKTDGIVSSGSSTWLMPGVATLLLRPDDGATAVRSSSLCGPRVGLERSERDAVASASSFRSASSSRSNLPRKSATCFFGVGEKMHTCGRRPQCRSQHRSTR